MTGGRSGRNRKESGSVRVVVPYVIVTVTSSAGPTAAGMLPLIQWDPTTWSPVAIASPNFTENSAAAAVSV